MDILLIEHDIARRERLEKKIVALGHQVTTCTLPEEALKAVEQQEYSLILLGLRASVKEELELCRQLRLFPRNDHVTILAITDKTKPKDLLEILDSGADDYLRRPLRIEQLKLRLAAIERQWTRMTQLNTRNTYFRSVLRAMQRAQQLIRQGRDHHLVLQDICKLLTEARGILNAQIKVIDESGILVKIAEANGTSSIAKPDQHEYITTWLEHAGKNYGVMTVMLSRLFALTEEEKSFLNEVATDIASALYNVEIELKRRRTERALRESKARYRELGDSITDVFFALDSDLRCTYWNKASESLTGFSVHEALERSLYVLFPGIRGTEAEQGYLEAVQTQEPRSFIQTYQARGKELYFEVNMYPVQKEFSVFAKDVTYRKQMEDALKRSWDYLENLNNSLGDAIFTVNMPEQTIEYVNRAVEHIFGYTIDECIGKNTNMFFSTKAQYVDYSDQLQDTFTRRQEILRTEQLLKRKSGERFTAEITTTFLDEENRLVGIISIVRDITERKQMEIALEQERLSLAQKVEERTAELQQMNAQLARASQLKDEFLANMSHDLRTPLNAILGYAKILKKTNNLSPLQLEGVDTILSSGEHLLHLINDILDLSKIEAGRLELHLTEFHFPEFLWQIAQMIRIRAEHKEHIVFGYEADQDLPVGVYADEKRLREVLSNLLDNAVKFTDQGSVTFRVTKQSSRKVNGASQQSGADQEKAQTLDPRFQLQTRIRFQVDDTGSGIAPDQLNKIFLPFRQVGEHRYSPEGTGLGLAISLQLVKVMGGELQVNSNVGQGTTFWFELEFPEIPGLAKKPQLQQPEIIGYKGPQQTILIADDKPENRSLLTNMLLPLGFAVLEAANGEECVETALREKPEAILLDLLMPVVDGFESAERIRALSQIRDTKLIAISASVFEETRKKSLAAGCDDFLSKPIELEILLECLQIQLQLDWVYRPEAGKDPYSDTPASDVVLPSENAKLLRKWAECGNITRLLEQLTALEQSDDHYLPLLTELKKFVKSFQFQRVIDYLDRMENSHEE